MAKDPAFLFYPNDWMGGTMTFNRHLKGCYIDVLMAQFNSGPLSLEEVKTVLGSDFGTAWPTLQKKFKTAGGLFFNERLEAEKEKRRQYSDSRRNNKKRKDENPTHETSYEKHMIHHMENEDENTNEIVNETKRGAGEKLKSVAENFSKTEFKGGLNDFPEKPYQCTNCAEIAQPGANGGVYEGSENKVVSLNPSNQKLSNIQTANKIERLLFEAFDEQYFEQLVMKWEKIVDFNFEFNCFKEKLRADPGRYIHRDLGGIRLAFLSQLKNAKPKINQSGKVINGNNKNTNNTSALVAGFKARHGQ